MRMRNDARLADRRQVFQMPNADAAAQVRGHVGQDSRVNRNQLGGRCRTESQAAPMLIACGRRPSLVLLPLLGPLLLPVPPLPPVAQLVPVLLAPTPPLAPPPPLA